MKHTPGPWKCRQSGDGKFYLIGEGQPSWRTHVGEVHSDDIDSDEAAANASLIAAAPELLDLLKELVSVGTWFYSALEFDHGVSGCDIRERCLAAIEKAEGKTL